MNQTRPGYFDDVITGGNYIWFLIIVKGKMKKIMKKKIVVIQNYFNATYTKWMVFTFEVARHLLNLIPCNCKAEAPLEFFFVRMLWDIAPLHAYLKWLKFKLMSILHCFKKKYFVQYLSFFFLQFQIVLTNVWPIYKTLYHIILDCLLSVRNINNNTCDWALSIHRSTREAQCSG